MMETLPPRPDNVEAQIAALQSKNDAVRLAALRSISGCKEVNRQALDVLWTLSERDPNVEVRRTAREVYLSMERPAPIAVPASIETRPSPAAADKWTPFFFGFVGWFVFNGLFLIASGVMGNLILLPINLIVLLVLALRHSTAALGMLAAFALNFLITLIIGMSISGICGIPFFVPLRY